MQVAYSPVFLMTQGVMLGTFWAHNRAECQFLYELPSFRNSGLELRELWQEVTTDGASRPCTTWCAEGRARHIPACLPICKGFLQGLFAAAGRPSMDACMSYRFVIMVCPYNLSLAACRGIAISWGLVNFVALWQYILSSFTGGFPAVSFVNLWKVGLWAMSQRGHFAHLHDRPLLGPLPVRHVIPCPISGQASL
jgi:hypothetical protein